MWLRATLPRFRYDQLMDLGWKKLIPASLFWLLLVAALRIGRRRGLEPGLRPRRRRRPWAALGWWALSAALALGQMDDADLSPATLG